MNVKQEPCDSYEAPVIYRQMDENDSVSKSQKFKTEDLVGDMNISQSQITAQLMNVNEFKQEMIEYELPKTKPSQSWDLLTKIDDEPVHESSQIFPTVKQELDNTYEVISKYIKEDVSECVQLKNESDLLISHIDLQTLKNESTDYIENVKKSVSRKWYAFVRDYISSKSKFNQNGRHLKKQLMVCNICGKVFVKEFEFFLHYFIHSVNKKKKTSKLIEKKTRNGTDYRKFASKKPFKSESYSRRYTNKIRLNKCRSKIYFKCDFCFKQFRYPSLLSNHLRIHSNEKLLKCDICSIELKHKSSLKTHLLLIHSKTDKLFKCEICLKQFSNKSHLTRHSLIHSIERPKQKCNVCLKEFRDTSDLQRHLKIHSNETPFKCNVCLKEYQDTSSLQRHLKSHSNNKPFKCDICCKEFRENYQLSRHLKTHSDEKPHKCDFCPKEYKEKYNLNEHLKNNHVNDR